MCSMAVAAGMPAAGLVLVSYPLHPPGRPDRLRTEHFGSLNVPCLFVSGPPTLLLRRPSWRRPWSPSPDR